MDNHSLANLTNYKQCRSPGESSVVAFSKFLNIAGDYLVQCVDNIHTRNTIYYKYIVSQGLGMIGHVFLTLYLYTNNLDLTAFHCHKAIYYYIEFIEQVGDETHSFLQLNVTDAILFVYKKTIFGVDSKYRKEFASSKCKWSPQSNLDKLVSMYTRHNEMSLSRTEINLDDKIQLISQHKAKLDKLCDAIVNISAKGEDVFGEKLDLLETLHDGLAMRDVCKTEYLEKFCKRLRNRSTNESQLKSRIKTLIMSLENCETVFYTSTKLAQLLLPS